LGVLGFRLDEAENGLKVGGQAGVISVGRPIAMVVGTNEELMIAHECQKLLKLV
jgi:acetate kinase